LGFITAGHGLQLNSTFGVGTVRRHHIGGTVDAAWVQINSNVNVSNAVGHGQNLSSSFNNNFTTGRPVQKIGASSGITFGTIQSTSAGHAGLINLIRTDAYSARGDSGGAVFTGNILMINPIVYGIVIGGLNPSGHGMIFGRATNIFAHPQFSDLSRY